MLSFERGLFINGWTGMRWGEVIGLEQPAFQLSTLRVDWQLSELNGIFTMEPPKEESYRNGEPDNFGPIDLPPFLSDLLSRHVQARPNGRCTCPQMRCGGTGKYLFLGPRRGHHGRSTFARRCWHPAVDGVYPEEKGKRPRPARPVLVDMSAGWPGRPLRPAWPFAVSGRLWEPPRGRGRTRHDDRTVASWLPIRRGLTPHGLRHAHKTWMIEDGIREVLQHDRLGHEMPGIAATYSHVSDQMRNQLKRALQARWETALDQRLALHPRSPVAILDELLAARAGRTTEDDLPNISQKGGDPIPLIGEQGL